jgi:hypothetical protein
MWFIFIGAYVLLKVTMPSLGDHTTFAEIPLPIAILLAFAWLYWRIGRAKRLSLAAMKLTAEGQLEDASRIWDALCLRPPTVPMHAIFIFNRATVHVMSGNFDTAASLYSAIIDSLGSHPKLLSRVPAAMLKTHIAAFHAWANNLETAEDLLHELADNPNLAAQRKMTSAIVKLRREESLEALAIIESAWTAAEATLSPQELTPLRIVRAYCLHLLQRETDPQYVEQANRLSLEDLERTSWVATSWPELGDFLRMLKTNSSPNSGEAEEA